ncbi:hypothetical protein POTOM_023697 [Populus tomentosa]|uniref:PPIase cyclophilin-type domain-containing protein n=1 Tax=Populus tomentosa TaxID=118781 RepID=A0A8X8D177_POPTO|nr:hypothetical protein POTOM_023697 [Populus tomentosa]
MCTSYSYKNTLVHKIFPGQFFLAGRQGRREKGEVKVPQDLARNFESVDSKAFKLTHSGPGILSLCLSENDDEDNIKLNPEYRNVEFLITTGPGPCPQLDYKNIVFGVVLEGSRPGPDSTTFNSSSASESEAAFNPCTTLPLVSGLPQVLGLPFPPSLPQIPGLPSVPGLPQIPRLPPTPPLPQIPGTLVTDQLFAKLLIQQMIALNPLFPSLLNDACGRTRGAPTAASATSKGSAGRLDVVTSIASIPTYKPSDRIRQFNDLAEFLGDERAQNARTIWNKPLKTVYISDCGELKVAKPSLTPSLP